jgi:hypothetical protein
MTKKEQNTIAWVLAALAAIYFFFFTKKSVNVVVGSPVGSATDVAGSSSFGSTSTPVVSTPTGDPKADTHTPVVSGGSTPVVSTPTTLSPAFGGSDSLPPSMPVVETPTATVYAGGSVGSSFAGSGFTITPRSFYL